MSRSGYNLPWLACLMLDTSLSPQSVSSLSCGDSFAVFLDKMHSSQHEWRNVFVLHYQCTVHRKGDKALSTL